MNNVFPGCHNMLIFAVIFILTCVQVLVAPDTYPGVLVDVIVSKPFFPGFHGNYFILVKFSLICHQSSWCRNFNEVAVYYSEFLFDAKILYATIIHLRYHGRWILPKIEKNIFFAFRIEKTEINILQKNENKSFFYF